VREPKFLTLAEVLYLHDESLHRFGGREGIGDLGLIESAIGSAKNAFWYGGGDIYEIAAAYAFHIAESQAFTDGNKRTGAAAALSFLLRNGVDAPVDDDTIYNALIDIANKRLDKVGLIEVTRRFCSKGTSE
jgi:death-on-curing protein